MHLMLGCGGVKQLIPGLLVQQNYKVYNSCSEIFEKWCSVTSSTGLLQHYYSTFCTTSKSGFFHFPIFFFPLSYPGIPGWVMEWVVSCTDISLKKYILYYIYSTCTCMCLTKPFSDYYSLHSELSASGGNSALASIIARNVEKTVKLFNMKCEELVFTGWETLQVSSSPNPAQLRNIAVVNALHAFNKLMNEVRHGCLARCLFSCDCKVCQLPWLGLDDCLQLHDLTDVYLVPSPPPPPPPPTHTHQNVLSLSILPTGACSIITAALEVVNVTLP